MAESAFINKTHLPHRLDAGAGSRAAIGLIALATDGAIEHEWRRLLDLEGVDFFVNRIPSAPTVTPDNLRSMEGDLTRGAELILPGSRLDVVAYGCTSASLLIGEANVARHIRAVRPGVAWTTPVTAAKAALKALGLERIALLTPYIEEINDALREHLQAAGFQVPVMGSFTNSDDTAVARIDPDSTAAAALELGRVSGVEGVFVSCTNLRLAERVAALEAELGKPVTSSCHAMAWHALRLAGCGEALAGRGRLFMV